MGKSTSEKVYVAYKPCKKPKAQFQWNGYGGKNPKFTGIPGVCYFEDEVGYYWVMGELECDVS